MKRDPELPNGFQDADFEMRDLEAKGAAVSRLRKQGICAHGWGRVPDVGECECLYCGQMFPNKEAFYAAWHEVMGRI